MSVMPCSYCCESGHVTDECPLLEHAQTCRTCAKRGHVTAECPEFAEDKT